MEERKLIRLGNSSFAIALPKEWIDKSGLKKGDKVFILPNSNGELMISPEFKKGNEKETEMNLGSKDEKEMSRELIAAYVKGNSTLKIHVDNKEEGAKIKKVLEDLPGVEIAEETSNLLLAKDMVDMSTISVPGLIRRLDNIIRNIIEELEPCVKAGALTQKKFAEIYSGDREINRQYFLIWRTMLLGLENPAILSNLKADYSSLVHTWWVGMNLEKIGDELKRIARELTKKKISGKEHSQAILLFENLKKDYFETLNAYHKNDKKSGLELAKNRHKFFNSIKDLEDSSNPAIHAIADKMKNIQDHLHHINKSVVYFIK